MNRYRYMFFDAQIILTTGMHAVGRGGLAPKADMKKMFIQSVHKVIREVGCDRPFLLWDSSPYHKSQIFKDELGEEDYKGDRGYVSEWDVPVLKEKYEKLLAELGSEHEDTIKAKNTYESADRQVTNFKNRSAVKYEIINELQEFGITSIIKKHWEADDIAALIAKQLKNDNRKSLFITKDGDWPYLTNKNIDVYNNFAKSEDKKWQSYETVTKFYDWFETDFPDWDLYELKLHIDSLYGSHNNLKKTILPEWANKPMRDIVPVLYEHWESDEIPILDNTKLFKAQMKSGRFENYPDYEFISNCLPWYLKKGKLGRQEDWNKYVKENKLNMNPMGYRDILNTLSYEEFHSGE